MGSFGYPIREDLAFSQTNDLVAHDWKQTRLVAVIGLTTSPCTSASRVGEVQCAADVDFAVKVNAVSMVRDLCDFQSKKQVYACDVANGLLGQLYQL